MLRVTLLLKDSVNLKGKNKEEDKQTDIFADDYSGNHIIVFEN